MKFYALLSVLIALSLLLTPAVTLIGSNEKETAAASAAAAQQQSAETATETVEASVRTNDE